MALIRSERPDDATVVRELNERAFGRPDEVASSTPCGSGANPTISLVAVDESDAGDSDGRVIGHILFNQVTIESPDKIVMAIGLGPMAVLPERQRAGVGTRLIEQGLQRYRRAMIAAVVDGEVRWGC